MSPRAKRWYEAISFLSAVAGLVAVMGTSWSASATLVFTVGLVSVLGGILWILNQWNDDHPTYVGAPTIAAALMLAAGAAVLTGEVVYHAANGPTFSPQDEPRAQVTTPSSPTSSTPSNATPAVRTPTTTTSRTGRNQPAAYPDTKIGEDNYVDLDTVTSSTQPTRNQEVRYNLGSLRFYDQYQSEDIRQLFQDTQIGVVADAKASPTGCRNATNRATDGSLDLTNAVTDKESICVSTSEQAWAILKVKSLDGPAIFDVLVYKP